MTVTTSGDRETPWWSNLPLDRVVAVHGASVRDLAESIDPLPEGAPAVVFYAIESLPVVTARQLVDDVIAEFEKAAVLLGPLWLTDIDALAGGSTLDRQAARIGARRLAGRSDHFGPYVEILADAVVSGRPPRPDRVPLETRAAGSARLLAAAQDRNATALVLSLPDGADVGRVATAAEWLCTHAGIGVWLSGAGVDDTDRFPTAAVNAPAVPADVATVFDRHRPLSYRPVPGHPHPASEPEQRLRRALDAHRWATDREHNRAIRLGPLSRPFTVDIVWRAEMIVVEIDGREHRGAHRFAEDRTRDNQLQTHGYMVLRFTNEQVVDDLGLVVATIRDAVLTRTTQGSRRSTEGDQS